VLEHDERGELVTVRWNGDDRGPVSWEGEWEDSGKTKVEAFYDALRSWEGLLRGDGAEYWTALEPGKALSEWMFSAEKKKVLMLTMDGF
jgi:trimethyllysine dioxygenase